MPEGSSYGVASVYNDENELRLPGAAISLPSAADPHLDPALVEGGAGLLLDHVSCSTGRNTDIETGKSDNGGDSPRIDSNGTTPRFLSQGIPTAQKSNRDYDMRRVIIAYSLCCLSSIVSHVLRMPLSTNKVELQLSLDLQTTDLTHLDNSFMILHTMGQMASTLLANRVVTMLPVTAHHFVIGVAISLLYVSDKLIHFMFVYAIAGFVSGPVSWILFSHLSTWLPEEHSFPMMTLWFTCTDIGYICGAIMCFYIQEYWNWRWSYVVSGMMNVVLSVLLFCLHDERKQPLDSNKLVDPKHVIQVKISHIVKFFKSIRKDDPKINKFISESKKQAGVDGETRLDYILSGIEQIKTKDRSTEQDDLANEAANPTTFVYRRVEELSQAARQYISGILKMVYIGRIVPAHFILRLVRSCISSWISYYVCTVYDYTTSEGTFVSFVLRVGNCVGNIVPAMICNMLWMKRPLKTCFVLYGVSASSVLALCLLDLTSSLTASLCCCTCGILTASAEAIMMAKGIRSLCDRSNLTQSESMSIYSFLVTISTMESLAQGFLVSYVVEWYGWTLLFSIFVVALIVATGLLYEPAKDETLN